MYHNMWKHFIETHSVPPPDLNTQVVESGTLKRIEIQENDVRYLANTFR